MWNVGPIAVTGGVPVTVPAPLGAAGIADRVIINNQSPLTLEIQAGATYPWLNPNQQYEVKTDGSSPLVVTPAGSGSGFLFLSWYGAFETEPAFSNNAGSPATVGISGAVTANLAGGSSVGINGAVTNNPNATLIKTSTINMAAASNFNDSVPGVPASTRSVLIILKLNPGTGSINPLTLNVIGDQSGLVYGSWVIPSSAVVANAVVARTCPVYGIMDTSFTVGYINASTATLGIVASYAGLPDPLVSPVILNPDIGVSHVSASAGEHFLMVPNPPVEKLLYQVGAISIINATAGIAEVQFAGVVTGNILIDVYIPANATLVIPGPGPLVNEGVNVLFTVTPVRVSLFYRSVPTGSSLL